MHSRRSTEATGTLGVYLRDIREEALLTAGEERALAAAVAAGDAAARTRLIRANLRLVVRVARDYAGRGLGLALEDLVAEGNLGLIRAAEEFDPAFGTRFSTYAGYWIRQAIREALTNTAATIRLPAHMVNLMAKWRAAERRLHRETGRAPAPGQVGDALGLTEAQRVLAAKARRAGRLVGQDDGERGWVAEEVPGHAAAPEAAAEASDDRRDLVERVGRLGERERAILTLRYGLGGEEPLTLKEVGQRLGITREWVRKLEFRALARLGEGRREAANA